MPKHTRTMTKLSEQELDTAKDIVLKISQEESVDDWLDEKGVTDERLDDLASKELKLFCPVDILRECEASLREPRRGSADRKAALTVLQCLSRQFLANADKWFDAVVLLDAYCCQRPEALQEHSVPIICAALVSILLKQGGVSSHNFALCAGGFESRLLMQSLFYTNALQGPQGLAPEEASFTEDDLHEQEKMILTALRWRVAVPTISEWMASWSQRLNVCSCGTFAQATAPLWQYARYMASLLSWDFPWSSELAPRRVGLGVVSLTWVASGLFSSSDLGLDESSEEASSILPSCPQVPELRGRDMAIFLAVFLLATSTDLETLQEDAHTASVAILASPTIASLAAEVPPAC